MTRHRLPPSSLALDRGGCPTEAWTLATATPASHSAKRVDGRVIIALTRFDALDGAMDCVPFGLTTPEMPALMGAPGCRSAVALDGGISSQLRLRDTSGTLQEWRGLRKVPLALLAFPRGKPR